MGQNCTKVLDSSRKYQHGPASTFLIVLHFKFYHSLNEDVHSLHFETFYENWIWKCIRTWNTIRRHHSAERQHISPVTQASQEMPKNEVPKYKHKPRSVVGMICSWTKVFAHSHFFFCTWHLNGTFTFVEVPWIY